MSSIKYNSGGQELLDTIEPLWRGLCQHHARISPHFSQWFLQRQYSERKAEICSQASTGMLVQLALSNSEPVGYCVSTLASSGAGEIDSIFVLEDWRRKGIGDQLMHNALEWLREQQATSIAVVVVYGNDQAQQWYQRFGFAPRLVKMVQLAST